MKRALALLLFAAACSSEPSPDDADGGLSGARDADLPITDAAMGTVEPGTGLEHFESIVPGQVLELIRGPQGGGPYFGYHIWSGAKLGGYPFGVARVRVTFHEADSGEQRALQERNVSLLSEGADKVVFGMAPRIDDCCLIAGREIIIRVAVESADGPFGQGEVRAVAGDCLGEDGSSLCP